MSKHLHAWHTWWSFSHRERIQWLQAWLLLPLVVIALRLFGLGRVQVLLDCLTRKPAGRVDLPAAQALARIFYSAVHRSFVPARCLEQSLVLHWLLRSQGLSADLRIGVTKLEGQLAAHAWVEHRGLALEENEMKQEFVAFDQILTSQGRDV